MRYISIDIETTGLDSENNQILSIGAIIEDTNNPLSFEESPKFHGAILRRGDVTGSMFALDMNRDLISQISAYQEADEYGKKLIETSSGIKFYYEDEIVEALFNFLWKNGIAQESFPVGWLLDKNVKTIDGLVYPMLSNKIPKVYLNAAGKNFGTFDLKFLVKLPRWQQIFKVRQRILDPAILYVNWEEDESLPSLNLCKERANIKGEVTHNALEDAWDVVLALRPSYVKK